MDDELKVPLFLVEYYVDQNTMPVWYWETEKEVRMSPNFSSQELAMNWLEKYEERV